MNYYNENDPRAAAWLRELIKHNAIAEGVVDERSIEEVQPEDLHEFTQCHFFAGIGGWSYALRLAGIPDDEPVWTGSCPCQPFSVAGQQRGTADERHLWPVFFNLIRKCRPSKVFGEQVASKAGREWLTGVFADLENVAYATAGADLCAAGVGSPHIRQRLYWVAYNWGRGRKMENQYIIGGSKACEIREASILGMCCGSCRVEHPEGNGREQRGAEPGGRGASSGCGTSGVGDTDNTGSQGRHQRGHRTYERAPWSASVALACADGKSRRVEPGSFPLAHGIPGRVGLLRGYGNAIVPQVAAAFIEAAYEAYHDGRSYVLMSDPMF